ncbi:MAG: 4Fe-4S binding protein [Eubacteriales bacterium]|nr:4Fe-4S binding protein [Eubacteriales bacterium]
MRNYTSYTIYKAVFSPTYGTAHAATLLAEQMDLNLAGEKVIKLDLTTPAGRSVRHFFSASDLVIAGAPVYGGQLPPVEGLFENLHGNQTPCILLVGYGNRHYENALAQMKRIMTRQGFLCIGAIACIVPHTFAPAIGAGRPNLEDLSAIAAFANALRPKFETAGAFTIAEVPGDPCPEANPKKEIPKALDRSRCTECGLCSASCPAGAIHQKTNEIDSKVCINCMRCAFVCPEKARSFQAEQTKAWLEENCAAPKKIEWYL